MTWHPIQNDMSSLDVSRIDAYRSDDLPAMPLAKLTALLVSEMDRTLRSSTSKQWPGISLLDWGRRYLPAHFSKPASKMHQWLGVQLDAMLIGRGIKINLIGPRGAAKSTIGTLCHVLRSAVEQRESYIWVVSDTKHQAQMHLENIKVELIENRRLAADYSMAVGRGQRWRSSAIELTNGVTIEAYGTGQRIRGKRRQANRPTLIVCDDLQNDGHMVSAVQRRSSDEWFHGTLLKAGTKRTNIVNLATALHRDALALQLHRTPGWESELFRAICSWPTHMETWKQWEQLYSAADDPQAVKHAIEFYEQHRKEMDQGVELLWPEEEDLYTLMKMRVESGHTAFEREKQGSPIDPEVCEWPEEYFADHVWFEHWPKQLVVKVAALDPSKGGDARRGDYSAIVMLGIDPEGVIYVEADLKRRPSPQIVADCAVWCQQFRPLAFGVEANQFQELLADELAAEFKRQKIHLMPCAIHNHVNKELRIRRLGPPLSQRRFRFRSTSPATRILVDQLRDFPAGAHDDGPDALEMALRLAETVWQGKNINDGLGNRLPVG